MIRFSIFALALSLVAVSATASELMDNTDTLGLEAREADANPTCGPRLPKNPQLNCGTQGYIRHPDILKNTTDTSLTSCRDSCLNVAGKKCASFSFVNPQGPCTLYNQNLKKMGLKKQTGNEVVYNRHCFKCKAINGCHNSGVAWALYPNVAGPDSDNSNSINYQNQFDPTVYKTTPPSFVGKTPTIGLPTFGPTGNITIYDSAPTTFDSLYFTLNHVGYIYAPTTGTYTIRVPTIDDVVDVWVGTTAQSGYSLSNDVISKSYFGYVTSGGPSYSFSLNAGVYYPFRIMFGQAQGHGFFDVDITDPNGNTLISTTSTSNSIVQFSCDLTTAPKFAPFGSET